MCNSSEPILTKKILEGILYIQFNSIQFNSLATNHLDLLSCFFVCFQDRRFKMHDIMRKMIDGGLSFTPHLQNSPQCDEKAAQIKQQTPPTNHTNQPTNTDLTYCISSLPLKPQTTIVKIFHTSTSNQTNIPSYSSK